MKHLSPNAARTNLTDRECTKLLSGCIGSLLQMASLDDVRNAVRWFTDNEEFWTLMEKQKSMLDLLRD